MDVLDIFRENIDGFVEQVEVQRRTSSHHVDAPCRRFRRRTSAIAHGMDTRMYQRVSMDRHGNMFPLSGSTRHAKRPTPWWWVLVWVDFVQLRC